MIVCYNKREPSGGRRRPVATTMGFHLPSGGFSMPPRKATQRQKAQMQRYRLANIETIRARRAAKYRADPETAKARARAWYYANRDKHGHQPRIPSDLQERFDAHVTGSGGARCWPWQGTLAHTGYGQIRINGYTWSAHRLSYHLHHGSIPDSLCILHHCDNRLCVNPLHLYAGTRADNNRDARARGRIRTGVNHPHAKLNPAAVRRILTSDEGNVSLGVLFGVTRQAINNVRKGKVWRTVTYDRAVNWVITEVIPGLDRQGLDEAVADELRGFGAPEG